jgi:transcription elongation factor Elf1
MTKRKSIRKKIVPKLPELLNCPFCGSKKPLCYEWGLNQWTVSCNAYNKVCCTATMTGGSLEGAVEMWNRREK